MTMIFQDVSDIQIPQGEVIKIHETNSGRILWEKKTDPPIIDGYPRFFFKINSASVGTVYYHSYFYTHYLENGDYIFLTTPEGMPVDFQKKAGVWSLTSLQHKFYNSHYSWLNNPLPLVNVGDTITAYYVNNETEFNNFTTQAHLVEDCSWSFLNDYSTAQNSGKAQYRIQNINYNGSPDFTPYYVPWYYYDEPFITFNTMTGSTISVKSLKTNFSDVISVMNSKASENPSYDKTTYPVIRGSISLIFTCPFINNAYNDGGLATNDYQVFVQR